MRYLKFVLLIFVGVLSIGTHSLIEVEASEVKEDSLLLNNLDPSVTISEPMSAEELISEYMANEEVEYDVAKKALFPNGKNELLKKNKDNNSIENNEIVPFVNRHRTIEKSVSPYGKAYFYCATSESPPNFRGIVKVLNAGYNTGSKIYSGTLFYNLVNGNRIDFILNGHLYNKGTFGTSGGGSIGIGQSATLSFNVSYSSSYFKPVYVNSRVRF